MAIFYYPPGNENLYQPKRARKVHDGLGYDVFLPRMGYMNPTWINGTFAVYVPTFRLYPLLFSQKIHPKKPRVVFIGAESLIDPVTLSPRMKDWHCPAANVLNDLSPTMSAHDATEVPCHQPEFRGFWKLWKFATYMFVSVNHHNES